MPKIPDLSPFFNKVFTLEEEKRIADKEKFERFTNLVSYSRVDRLSYEIQTGSLSFTSIDLFDDILNFYDSPERNFYSRKLQKRSREFEEAFRKLEKFTAATMKSDGPVVLHFLPPNEPGGFERFNQELETGTTLVLKMGRAYLDFLKCGREKRFSNNELIATVLVIAFALVGWGLYFYELSIK